jgi:2-polyprenyl-6-hydroxyphenyl methylase/3-demethylubiquinone-9 3-methyltransferase
MGSQDGKAVNNAFYDDLGERWLHAQDDPVALLRAEGLAKQAWVKGQLERLLGPFPASTPASAVETEDLARAPLKILDIGCGAGFLARALRADGHEVHALDASLPSLRVSRGVDASVGYVRGNAFALPYRDDSFDGVASMDFLEHVEDPAAAVREAARVLRPGGLFFFHTFSRNLLAWLVIIKGAEWFVRNTPERMHVLRLFIKPAELAGFCRASGLEPLSWTGVRPDFRRAAFWRMLATGVVPEDFRFVLTPSLKLSYLGVARKGTGSRATAAFASGLESPRP